MNKVLLIAAVATVLLTSCKKDYTCECTSTGGGMTTTASVTFHTTKKKAKESCDTQASASAGGTSVSTTCALK